MDDASSIQILAMCNSDSTKPLVPRTTNTLCAAPTQMRKPPVEKGILCAAGNPGTSAPACDVAERKLRPTGIASMIEEPLSTPGDRGCDKTRGKPPVTSDGPNDAVRMGTADLPTTTGTDNRHRMPTEVKIPNTSTVADPRPSYGDGRYKLDRRGIVADSNVRGQTRAQSFGKTSGPSDITPQNIHPARDYAEWPIAAYL